MRSSVALLSAAVLAVSGVLVTPVAARAVVPVGRVLSVTADPGPFAVDGFAGQASSMITVTIDQPIYKPGGCLMTEHLYTGVEAVLERTSGGPPVRVSVDLPHVAVTGIVQTYRVPWRIASTRTGTWTLVGVTWCDMAIGVDPSSPGDVYENRVSVDPRVDPGVTASITVVGTHAATAMIERIPATVPAGARQWGRFTYRTVAGAPIVGATVMWGVEYACNDPMPPTPGGPRTTSGSATLRTDAHGQVTRLLDPWFSGWTCVSLLGPPSVAGDLGTRALVRQDWPYRHEYYGRVSAVPTAAAVRVNRILTVIGSVSPSIGVVRLQRLVGRTWRTVASAPIRASGRYTVYGLVTTIGRNYFRVVALNGNRTLAPTPSRVFVVTATRR